jgi:hypothetical protein
MRRRLMLPLLVIAAVAIAPASASGASYVVGIGEQNAAVFDQPLFQQSGVKRVRYLVPWDWNRVDGIRAETDGYVGRALAEGKDVFVTFTAKRGCWARGRYSKAKRCKAPTVKAYKRSVKQFRKRFPGVRTFAPWNEANHASQPTAKKPRLAARYYNAMRKVCKGCRLVALDILDQSDAVRYLKKFRRKAKGSPKRWGLHNYSDVNRRRVRDTRRILKQAPGELWLTETGGIVSFGRSFPYSEQRAKNRTKYMFRLANRFQKRRKGMRSRITRIYPYSWYGYERGARFDAGLVNPDGSARPALTVFLNRAKKARR